MMSYATDLDGQTLSQSYWEFALAGITLFIALESRRVGARSIASKIFGVSIYL